MLKKFLTAISFGIAASLGGAAETYPHSPYPNPASNAIYNLLFCDNPALFLPKAGEKPTHWQLTLANANIPALELLASDELQEGRVRYLAYSKLRALGQVVVPKILCWGSLSKCHWRLVWTRLQPLQKAGCVT